MRIANRLIRPGPGLARPMRGLAIVRGPLHQADGEREGAGHFILIPLFGAMTEAELDHVAKVLAEACLQCRSDSRN